MTKTKQEIINETVEYYNDASMRAYVSTEGMCMYLTEEGNMCAVGRCLIPESVLRVRHDHIDGDSQCINMKDCICSVMNIVNLEEVLKPEYRGHSIQFWLRLQNLHDSSSFFSDGTWNTDGRLHAKHIWRIWEEDLNATSN